MGKNKRRQLDFFDSVHGVNLKCDSQEEIDFLEWLIEAKSKSLIDDFRYQPESFLLSDKVDYINLKGKCRSLFREHIYSPDFEVIFDSSKQLALAEEFKVPKDKLNCATKVVLDVKGTFNRNGGDRNFSINQKWVYQKHQVYVYKLVPKDFFKKLGVPKACLMTKKTKKPRKAFEGYPTIEDCFSI